VRSVLVRRLGAILGCVGLAGGVVAAAWFVTRRGLDWADKSGSVAGACVALLVLAVPFLRWILRGLRGDFPVTEIDPLRARDDLAAALSDQGAAEERLRRVNDPRPLPVRWEVTPTAEAAMPGVPAPAGPEVTGNFADISTDRTTVIIAHRLQTVRTADRIFVLDKGRIIEAGSHEELLETAGHYARMWRAFELVSG
jgi:hypothetical protein